MESCSPGNENDSRWKCSISSEDRVSEASTQSRSAPLEHNGIGFAQSAKKVVVHTDGACLGNPGPGGWAAILEHGSATKEFAGGELATTNNRMELQAAIEGLSRIKEPCDVELFTDSEYLREGITKWISAWKARGWKKKVKNKDLWHELDTAAARHKVIWHWVRGHSGNRGNERCDLLAMHEAERLKKSSTREQLANALAEFEKVRSALGDQIELL
jgi:ribonuclease HI